MFNMSIIVSFQVKQQFMKDFFSLYTTTCPFASKTSHIWLSMSLFSYHMTYTDNDDDDDDVKNVT